VKDLTDNKHLEELIVLKEISETLNEGTDLRITLKNVLTKLLELTGFQTGWIFFIDAKGNQSLEASDTLPPALTHDDYSPMCKGTCWCVDKFIHKKLNRASNIMECKRLEKAIQHNGETYGLTHHASVPLSSGDEQFGILNIASQGKDYFRAEELALLESVAYQIGNSIKRIKLTEKTRDLALIGERNRLAKDLHDSVQQLLFSVHLLARAGATVNDITEQREILLNIQSITSQAQAEMKALIWQLRPEGLENGIVSALTAYGKTLGLEVSSSMNGVSVLPAHIEETLWRIGQEAFNNCKKHSGQTNINLSIKLSSRIVDMRITDLGTGFCYNPSAIFPSLGLQSLRERTDAAGGEFTLTSSLGKGTMIHVTIPF